MELWTHKRNSKNVSLFGMEWGKARKDEILNAKGSLSSQRVFLESQILWDLTGSAKVEFWAGGVLSVRLFGEMALIVYI